jgi:carbon monoxide dehydrogenase subunit G
VLNGYCAWRRLVVNVNIKIERSLEVAAPLSEVSRLLEDIEGTIRRFPKLRKLTRVGDDAWLWEMAPIGSKAAGIAHEVRYGAQYTVDAQRGRLSWKPVPKQGNATIEGAFQLSANGSNSTRLTFDVKGELRDVPVPLVYRLLAPPFIQGKFTRLVEIFLEATRDSLLADSAVK